MPGRHAGTPAPVKPGPSVTRPVAAPEAETAHDSPLLRGTLGQRGMPSPRAQAEVVHSASGGRLARAGDALLQLQRQYGNYHVQQVIGHAREATSPVAAPVVQAKLLVGPASDRYEREADRVADGAAGHAASRDPAAHRQAGEDKYARLLGQPGIQQMHGAGGGAVDAPVAQALQRKRGAGQPLPAALRSSMEQALGADFGGVRVHTGARSDQLNRSLQAAAFTSGQDIYFRRGAYSPASQQGTALLAHELTHVVQQRNLRRNTVQRHFAPPVNPYRQVTKPMNPLGRMQRAAHPSSTAGWAISKNVETAHEMLVTGGMRGGHKVTRFTALLTPGHANLGAGVATRQGTDPLGWAWVERNEVRSANRNALRYWIRFHLLNAKLGGKGISERHLVPTTKSANAQWDQGIERPMTAALKGASPTPVYYDVQLRYWGVGDAPSTYLDAATGMDYSQNIMLFPEEIEGNWQRFVQGRWVAQKPLTVAVDKPRGISGEDVELATHQNLKNLGHLFHIDEEILGLLQRGAPTTRINTYGDVRQMLETWAIRADTWKKVSRRQQAIFESDGYLRTALAGGQSFKLRINNQHIPDDATPEARMFGPTVEVNGHRDLDSYESLTSSITIAYGRAQGAQGGAVNFFPSFEEFLWQLATKGPLYPVKLTDVQQQWDTFKTANESLPPMSDMHLLPEQDEIFYVLQRRTKPLVVQWVRDTFSERVRALTKQSDPVAVADQLAHAVDANYDQLVRRRFPALTVEHADQVAKLAQALLEEDPVRPLAIELYGRLAAAPHMVASGISRRFPYHPFIDSLNIPMVGPMNQMIADEQKRWMPPPPPPQSTQPPPTHRPILSKSSGSPRRYQPDTSAIHKREAKTHPYNQAFIIALRAAIPDDRRYPAPADEAGRREVSWRRKKIEKRWKSPTKVPGKGSLEEDVKHALSFIFLPPPHLCPGST
jgi:Domain of unknown function (DUF4157)